MSGRKGSIIAWDESQPFVPLPRRPQDGFDPRPTRRPIPEYFARMSDPRNPVNKTSSIRVLSPRAAASDSSNAGLPAGRDAVLPLRLASTYVLGSQLGHQETGLVFAEREGRSLRKLNRGVDNPDEALAPAPSDFLDFPSGGKRLNRVPVVSSSAAAGVQYYPADKLPRLNPSLHMSPPLAKVIQPTADFALPQRRPVPFSSSEFVESEIHAPRASDKFVDERAATPAESTTSRLSTAPPGVAGVPTTWQGPRLAAGRRELPEKEMLYAGYDVKELIQGEDFVGGERSRETKRESPDSRFHLLASAAVVEGSRINRMRKEIRNGMRNGNGNLFI